MKKPVRRWRGLLIVAAVLIVAAMLLAACGSSDTSSSSSPTAGGEPKAGGTYNFPLGAEPISIEPLNTQESEGWHVNHQVFQSLYCLQIQPDGTTTKAVPDLAEKTEVNADATVFTFTIKQGVMFQAPVSREVTAQDFVDSWNYNADPKNKSATTYIIAPIKGINPDTGYSEGPELSGLKVIDKYTFEVTLQYPFADFPATLVHPITQVFPVDYAKEIGTKKFFDKPVGTGPYMVDSWKHNQSITLVKNPDYWNTSNSGNSATPGYVDTIEMPIYTDVSTEWLAFQKGTLDYSSLPTGNFKAAQNDPKTQDGTWTVKAYPSTSVYFISVAMNKPTLGGDANLPIRAALNYAADREVVSNIVNEGISIPSDSIVPVTIPGYVEGINPYPYDPAKAQPKLDEFTGTLPSEIPYWFNSGAGHDKIAQALVDGWTKAMPSLEVQAERRRDEQLLDAGRREQVRRPGPHGLDRRLPVDRQLHLPVHHLRRQVRKLQLLQQPGGRQALRAGARHGRRDRAQRPLQRSPEDDPHRRSVRPRVHVPGRPRDEQPDRRLHVQLVRSDQYVGCLGQVASQAVAR